MTRYRVNRKRKAERSVFPTPLAGVLTLAAFLALGYLWLCGRCDALGRDIQRLEQLHAELRRQVVAEEYRWAQMNTVRRIQAALDRFGIVMERPSERRVIRLSRPLEVGEWDAPQFVLQPGRGELGIP